MSVENTCSVYFKFSSFHKVNLIRTCNTCDKIVKAELMNKRTNYRVSSVTMLVATFAWKQYVVSVVIEIYNIRKFLETKPCNDCKETLQLRKPK